MNLAEIELHDALITNAAIDYKKKSLIIGIQYYKSHEDKDRSPANLYFEDVTWFSQNSDLDAIQRNTFAGHVNHWVPAQNGGTTYIYLVAGCISVTSGSVKISETNEG